VLLVNLGEHSVHFLGQLAWQLHHPQIGTSAQTRLTREGAS